MNREFIMSKEFNINDLSVRIINILARKNINSVFDIEKLSIKELEEINSTIPTRRLKIEFREFFERVKNF